MVNLGQHLDGFQVYIRFGSALGPDHPRKDPIVAGGRKIIPHAGKFGFYLLVGQTPPGIVGEDRKPGNQQEPEQQNDMFHSDGFYLYRQM